MALLAAALAFTGCGDLSPDLVVGRLRQDAGLPPTPVPVPDAGELDGGPPSSGSDSGFVVARDVDLVLVSVNGLPASTRPGDSFELVALVENLGLETSPASRVSVDLVPLGALAGANTIQLASVSVPPLASGDARDFVFRAQVPERIAASRYGVGAAVDPDGEVIERLEINNTLDLETIDVSWLEVDPLLLDFGAVGPGCTAERQVNLRHFGPGRAILSGARLVGTPLFVVEPVDLPATLPSQAGLQLSVLFSPLVLGTVVGDLVLDHDQFRGPQIVLVVGEGVNNPEREDVFVQRDRPQLDMVFVVQDACVRLGCAIEAEQRSLSAIFPVLRGAFSAYSPDWRVLVTTTDPSPGRIGQIRGPPITQSSPNVDQAFDTQIRAGRLGNPLVSGLAAAEAFIARGELRPSANVVIVFVGLDDDRSTGSPLASLARMRDGLGHRGADRLRLHGILPPPPTGCAGLGSPAFRFFDAIQGSGGSISTICDFDDYDVLFRLPPPQTGLTDRFVLTHDPISAATLVVEVDGRLVEPFDPSTGVVQWRFEPSTRTLLFESPSVPTPGQRVVIRYRSRC